METIRIKFKFNLLPGMVLHTLVLHTKILYRKDIDVFRTPDDHNIIEGEAEFRTSNTQFTFSFTGSGDITTPHTQGSYNFSYNNKNLFTSDKIFKVNKQANFGAVLTNVQLPN